MKKGWSGTRDSMVISFIQSFGLLLISGERCFFLSFEGFLLSIRDSLFLLHGPEYLSTFCASHVELCNIYFVTTTSSNSVNIAMNKINSQE